MINLPHPHWMTPMPSPLTWTVKMEQKFRLHFHLRLEIFWKSKVDNLMSKYSL
jgi:hypothetical protein